MEMKNSPLKLFVLLFITASLVLLSCKGGSGGNPDDPGTCALVIDDNSNGALDCNKTLTESHQHEIAMTVKSNHGLPCREIGDLIRISNLEMEWTPDGQGGWTRIKARCTAQYEDEDPKTIDLLTDHANAIQSILTQSAYCPLGTSCADECGCDEICCESGDDCCMARGDKCGNQRITTGGVIIAVVSSVPAK
jgi:hypothetical protein